MLPLLVHAVLASVLRAAPVTLNPEPLTIPQGESRQLTFQGMTTQDTTILLQITARMDAPSLSGSMFFMDIAVNGKTVLPYKTRTVGRLQNRPLNALVTPDIVSTWYGVGGWRVLYAPNFDRTRLGAFYEGDPFTTVLDITDLIDPLADNVVSIRNTAKPDPAKRVSMPFDLVIETAVIDTKPGASPMLAAADAQEHVINRGDPAAGPARYTGSIDPGGAIRLRMGERELVFDSAFSYPDAGLNLLSSARDPEGCQPDWQPRVGTVPDAPTVTAAGPDYTLLRQVRFTPRCVKVSDRITSRHDREPIGLMVRHSLRLSGLQTEGIRLAGNADPAVNDYYAPANPSVHVRLADLGIGMICEDRVFRNQARLFVEPDGPSAGLRTDMLCLQPGRPVTLEWAIYPVAGPDYYDFINLVREDWGSNYTVEGAWCFFSSDTIIDVPAEDLKRNLDRLGINFACSWGGWVDPKADRKRIGFGSEVLSDYWADYRERLRLATAKLHEARPGIKVLIYYDSQRDTHADATTRYPDSLLTNAAGVHHSTEWGGMYSLTWSMVATLGNKFGFDMLDVVDEYARQIGADGLYWDEMENVSYGYPYITYAIPDGVSCLVDPKTYTIQREIGVTTILGETHRIAVIDRVRKLGGTLMGNGPTTTKDLLAKQVQRMVEIQHNDFWAYEGNLDTPLGYASSRMDFGNVTRALKMATLLVGTRLDYPYEISRYLFPFTPMELHHGYLKGRERIITLHSGRYGWPEAPSAGTLRIFAADGSLREIAEVRPDDDGRAPVEVAEGEVAVLERSSGG